MRGAGDSDFMHVPVPITKAPDISFGGILVAQAGMRGEIRRRFGCSVQREIRRRGAAHELRNADLAADQAAAADIADADREIDALVDDIDCAVRELDVESQLWMAAR